MTVNHRARTARAQKILDAILPVAIERGVDVHGQRWFVHVPFAVTISGLSSGSLHRLDVRCGGLLMRVQWHGGGPLQVSYLRRGAWEVDLLMALGTGQTAEG